MTGWQATLVPRHICQVVFARRQKTSLLDVGAHQFRHVVFVSMPVGREQLYSWICLQRGFLFCGCSDLCWLLGILFSPFDEVTLCVQVGRMLRRLPHSVQQNDGRRVHKYQHAERFDCVVSVRLARIVDRKPQARSVSADVPCLVFVECYMEGDASVVFAGPQWLRERFLCDVGGVNERPLIASNVSHPRRARLWR